MDLLILLKRRLDGVVDFFGLRPLARRVYQRLLRMRYGNDGLARVQQNGRIWMLHHEVALRGELHEFETIEWLRATVKPGDCVIDVGANVGQMTLEAAQLVGRRGKVVAVEPAPGNLRLLHAHVVANGFADRVDIIEAACGAANGGEVTLNVYGGEADAVGSGHTIRNHALDTAISVFKIRVPTVSIDGLCDEWALKPSVIKIDVEGAEIEVIRGAISTLRKCGPQVRFGFHPFAFADAVAATRELRDLMANCGYETPNPDEGDSYDLNDYEAVAIRSKATSGMAAP